MDDDKELFLEKRGGACPFSYGRLLVLLYNFLVISPKSLLIL